MPVPIGRGDVQALLAGGAGLLDVLDAGEFARSHLPGAANVPLCELTPERVDHCQRDDALIVYGAGFSCDRGPRGARLLEYYGFGAVFEYEAGKDDWMAYGLPFEGDGTMLALHALEPSLRACCDERAAELRARMQAAGCDEAVVVNETDIVLGVVRSPALAEADNGATAMSMCELDPVTIRPSAPVEWAAQQLASSGRRVALVTTSSGRLLGQVSEAFLHAHTVGGPGRDVAVMAAASGASLALGG